ncbi:MAG TPA: TIGR01458 family HAD-type hydrolase [Bryobacteraceae bacterium]|nr:TIGR01458 family HAD-type hydrolase [Bryobacteraceae bacterium]
MPLHRPLALLFDMDGVLYNDTVPIDGASGALAWVRRHDIPHLFVTNTSSRSRRHLAEKLVRFGIAAQEGDIFCPPAAAAEWLRIHADGPVALFAPEKARSEFAGLDILPLDCEAGARYVVIGDLAEAWDFRTINRAFRLLHSNPSSQLIALGMTRFWQTPDGLQLDVGPFVAALECASGKRAIVFGKPAAPFFLAAAEKLGAAPEDVLMIGDDIDVDVGGAQRAGLMGALVKTGKFRPSDLERGVFADIVLDSVAALPSWLAAFSDTMTSRRQ